MSEREAAVLRGWEAYERGDIEGTLAIFHSDLVVEVPPEMANAGTFHGKEGFLGWLGQWTEAWDSFSMRVLEIESVGERHVLTRVHQHGRGRGSGIEVTNEVAWVFELRDGLCSYLGLRSDLDGARKLALERETRD